MAVPLLAVPLQSPVTGAIDGCFTPGYQNSREILMLALRTVMGSQEQSRNQRFKDTDTLMAHILPQECTKTKPGVSVTEVEKLSKRMMQATSVNLMKPQTLLYNLKSRIIWFLCIYTHFFHNMGMKHDQSVFPPFFKGDNKILIYQDYKDKKNKKSDC